VTRNQKLRSVFLKKSRIEVKIWRKDNINEFSEVQDPILVLIELSEFFLDVIPAIGMRELSPEVIEIDI
jgi:hypothetical protein